MSQKKKLSDKQRKRKHKIRAFKFWVIINILMPVLWLVARVYFRTWRISPELAEKCIEATKKDRRIFLLWHSHILITVGILTRLNKDMGYPLAVLMSPSRDGEVMAEIIRKTGNRIVRGSSNKRAVASLLEYRKVIEEEANPLFYIDGPKGPRGFPKSGFIHLLLHDDTIESYVPFFHPDKFWQLKSWDRHIIPKPFAKIDGQINQLPAISSISEKDQLLDRIHEIFMENSSHYGQDTSDIKKS